jgi:hypothetical protein
MKHPEEILKELVPQITSTGETWFAFYGMIAEVNLDIDETATSNLIDGVPEPVTLPCAVLLKPVQMTPDEKLSGRVKYNAPMFIYFLYDTTNDAYAENKQILIKKARKAASEFYQRVKGFTTHVDSATSRGIVDFDNTVQDSLFDRPMVGVTLDMTAIIDSDDSGCFDNEDNDVVRVYDQDDNLLVTTPCGTDVHVNVGFGDAEVRNSDDSYIQTGSNPLTLPDTQYNVYVDGNLDQSFSIPTLKDEVINIHP